MKELAFILSWVINLLICLKFELKERDDIITEYCSEYVKGSEEMSSCLGGIHVFDKVTYTGNHTLFRTLGYI